MTAKQYGKVEFIRGDAPPVVLLIDITGKKGNAMMTTLDKIANVIEFPDASWDRWNLLDVETRGDG